MDIKLTANNDRSINEEFVAGDEELAQAVKLTLSTNLNELEWHRNYGLSHQDILDNIKYRDYVLKQIEDCLASNFSNFESAKIISVEENAKNRLINIKLEVKMTNGNNVEVDIGQKNEGYSNDVTY